jgi:hypothetical protein
MELLFAGALTTLGILAIIKKYNNRKQKKAFFFRQSDNHMLLKFYINIKDISFDKKETQSFMYESTKTFKYVEMPDKKAYWLEKNKVYYTDINSGFFDPEKGKLLKTKDLSEEEVNKIVFIFNSLKKG